MQLRADRRIVTIFSDASFCPETKLGGWGCWVRSERGVYKAGGPLRPKRLQMVASNCAEIAAAANGLAIAIREGLLYKKDFVVFVLDNEHARRLIEGSLRPTKGCPVQKDAVEYLRSKKKEHDLHFKANHVKAHEGKDTPRKYVNYLADKLAKDGLKQAREMVE